MVAVALALTTFRQTNLKNTRIECSRGRLQRTFRLLAAAAEPKSPMEEILQ